MNQVPLVSIIIPSFQQGNYLKELLASINNQSFIDYEIVIVDGNSTDNTKEVVEEFSGFPVKFHQALDDGVYDAMNKGVRYAIGDWLYFIGCDDQLYDQSVLGSLLSSFEDKGLDVFYGDVVMKSDQSRYAGEFNLDRLLRSQNICHQAIFYRRTVFEKIGLYNLKYKVWADWELNIRCFRHTELVIKYVDVIVALYNNESGVSHAHDTVLKEELPLNYLAQINLLEKEKKDILESKSFLIGNKMVNFYVKLSKFLRLGN
ncbi:glycosyltransferase family 2 protein [Hymenobacter caeli]|uniref:Glycosyltransferase involved in cell wall biosynthesis n=1 Tax=Hymenobacter caeli TaxID=2735894 RepID=A0ABX2FK98_9BACT|nr:glycosyltransferase family 2 protein [Hymenobacter caeli]NRT17268.1 glycosyltransferase involved in cell wall biosynthesis [Hymenobacter caeli]